MTPASSPWPTRIGTRAYGTLVSMYPSRFRDEFRDEMMADFQEATDTALGDGGAVAVSVLWGRCLVDFACAFVCQWLSTGIPTLIVVAGTWSTLLFALLALQSVPQTRPGVPGLHLAWLIAAGTALRLSIALGRYHSKHA